MIIISNNESNVIICFILSYSLMTITLFLFISLQLISFLGVFLLWLFIFVVCFFKLISKSIKSFLLESKWSSISLIIGLAIPIFTDNLPAIEISTIHYLDTLFSSFLFAKFNFHHSIRMILVKPYSFYFSNIIYFLLDIFFNALDLSIIFKKFRSENMFHDYDSKPVTFLLCFFILRYHFQVPKLGAFLSFFSLRFFLLCSVFLTNVAYIPRFFD